MTVNHGESWARVAMVNYLNRARRLEVCGIMRPSIQRSRSGQPHSLIAGVPYCFGVNTVVKYVLEDGGLILCSTSNTAYSYTSTIAFSGAIRVNADRLQEGLTAEWAEATEVISDYEAKFALRHCYMIREEQWGMWTGEWEYAGKRIDVIERELREKKT